MSFLKTLFLAGAAIAGCAVIAPTVARELNTHRLTVALPGGGMETIEYSGNVAPRVIVHDAQAVVAPFAISWPAFPSFAAMDHMMADMDRQMAVMMHQADLLTRLSQAPLNQAVLEGLPAGTSSFSVVQTSSGNGVCTRVTRITQGAEDAKPQVVSQTSGCGESLHRAAPSDPDLKQIDYRVPAIPAPRTHL